ncbi:MAG: hypothetical protein H0X34_04445 [Chthoniobacterales bacterium]|nr:hypothetical protein [Chthoniobacterales bacterium]
MINRITAMASVISLTRNEMDQWLITSIEPVTRKRKIRAKTHLQIEQIFQKTPNSFQVVHTQRHMIE